ncbi:YeiH family protein [Solitalea lacus]|uniref:YeiH family protein n=1 Tax=Solitalea lacus TaxID=2911172 RepID=UPI001EDA7DFB|nr:putative sulfate exporter family transporter [Solitalea lacus]UKJ06422.1 putative sulfate exporter family transporter [Solitalea lacus]
MSTGTSLHKIAFIFLALFSFLPGIDSAVALLLGVVVVNIFGNPFVNHTSGLMHQLLKYSIIGMGFGVNFQEALKIGEEGLELTVLSILLTIILGLALGRLFRTEKKTSLMISSGTAICGGSAIAAISPVIEANPKQISVALGVVFLLNCVALFVFPAIGHYFGLSQRQFGLWAAIAIHDTSSVVGAAANYGSEALQIATTVKLCRALWIIPVSLIFAFRFRGDVKKISVPYFIFGYVMAMIISTYVPQIHQLSTGITGLAKSGFSLSLFLVGTGLSKSALKQVGIKPLLQGLFTWVFISAIALIYCINW